jgi:aromatic-amino-acid transaminase
MAARDPILGLNEAFAADPRPNKVNLGMGVYSDDAGKIPLLAAVKQAEAQLQAANLARGYLPIDGIVKYNLAVQTLLFGSDSSLIRDQRVATVQALGGTGALKVGADLLHRFRIGGDELHHPLPRLDGLGLFVALVLVRMIPAVKLK